eukprot:4666492-Pleurochrysis_carterae.AAC.1
MKELDPRPRVRCVERIRRTAVDNVQKRAGHLHGEPRTSSSSSTSSSAWQQELGRQQNELQL